MMRLLFLLAILLRGDASELKLTSFELTDQFGRAHRISVPASRPVLITIADHDGSAAMNPWIQALKSRYSTNVIYVAIADTRGTPKLMQPFIKAQFRKRYAHPVLLDWDGKISLKLSAKPNVPNIYLFSPAGELKVCKNQVYSEIAITNFPPRIEGSKHRD